MIHTCCTVTHFGHQLDTHIGASLVLAHELLSCCLTPPPCLFIHLPGCIHENPLVGCCCWQLLQASKAWSFTATPLATIVHALMPALCFYAGAAGKQTVDNRICPWTTACTMPHSACDADLSAVCAGFVETAVVKKIDGDGQMVTTHALPGRQQIPCQNRPCPKNLCMSFCKLHLWYKLCVLIVTVTKQRITDIILRIVRA